MRVIDVTDDLPVLLRLSGQRGYQREPGHYFIWQFSPRSR